MGIFPKVHLFPSLEENMQSSLIPLGDVTQQCKDPILSLKVCHSHARIQSHPLRCVTAGQLSSRIPSGVSQHSNDSISSLKLCHSQAVIKSHRLTGCHSRERFQSNPSRNCVTAVQRLRSIDEDPNMCIWWLLSVCICVCAHVWVCR